jgi:CubicO group peptidase (beta-lactamase class C family)
MRQRFLALFFLFSTTTYSQDFDRAKMDSLFMLIDQNKKGMNSISIFEDGVEVYQSSIGFADIEKNIKATENTKYRIGSISKTFTAVIIMGLIEEGKLSLDTKLSDFLPVIENAENITIEQLLIHQSGIYNFTDAEDYTSWMEDPVTREDLMEKIAGYGSSFEPGTKTAYSNANYVLLSYIAEKVCKKEFSELLDKRICAPCHLSDTYYGSKINSDKNEALSYYLEEDWIPATETDPSIPVGAGGIVSTPTDLNTFLHCLFTNKILKEETMNIMREIRDGYGIGMFQAPFYEKRAYGHTGGIDGFAASAFYFPQEKVSAAFCSNGQVIPMNDILIGVLSIYFGRTYPLPDFKPLIKIETEILDEYVGVYSSSDLPLKLTITRKGNSIFGQGTGQPEFLLEAVEINIFRFDRAGIEIEFLPQENELILRQGGGSYDFKKE